MATLEEEKRKRQQAATKAYTSALDQSTLGGDIGRAALQIQENSPFGLPARAASAAVRPIVSAVAQNYRRAQGLPPAQPAPAASGFEDSPFQRIAQGLQSPSRTPTRAAAPAITPSPRVDTSPAASDARIRAIANEGRVPDRRAAPPVIERPAPDRRAIFTEQSADARSAFAPDIQGAAAPTGAQFASPEEIARYRASVAQRGVEGEEEAYRRALEGTTLSSGDTWFDFMRKNQQRAAILAARKGALEQEKLASGERMQERRGEIEGALQQERLGAERSMLGERLGSEASLQKERLTAAQQKETAEAPYRGALQRQAEAQAGFTELRTQDLQQEQALRKELAETKDPVRRNIITNILSGKQDTTFDTLMGKVLENASNPNDVLAVMSQAKAEANDPTSQYFGDPLSAYTVLVKTLQGAGGENKFAMGGVVDAEGYAQGGAVGIQQFGGLPEVDETAQLAQLYTQYAQTTQAMGATPVGFNKFATLMTTVRDRMAVPMQDPSAMGMPGYAQGGAVDVSGQQVFGPGTETSDSIPAIIDGQTPAALSTNEFVWTANATEAASPAVLKAVMTGLERNDPEIVSGIMALAAKAVKKPAQPAME